MGNNKLSTQQKEVLDLLTLQYMTPLKIASVRNTTPRAVYKTIKKLKEKGFLKGGFTRGFTKPDVPISLTSVSDGKKVRLHGMEFNIKLIKDSEFYHGLRGRGNFVVVDGHKVRLYRGSVEVYECSDHSFVGGSVNEVNGLAAEFWSRFFVRLEDRLKVVLLKDRYHNVRVVKHHYAEVGNELAEDCRLNKSVLRVFAREDGKLWLVVDFSHGVDELETQHSETAGEDMERVRKYFVDWRDNDPPTNGELAGHFKSMCGVMEMYAENMVSHVKAVKNLGEAVDLLKSELSSTSSILHDNNINIVDRLLSDDMLRERFNCASKEEKDRMLGLK